MPERSYTRRDTVMFLGCLGASLVMLFLPRPWGQGIGTGLRRSVLAPFVWMQSRAEEAKTSRSRLHAVTAQRDSLAYVVQMLPALRVENERLRHLLALSRRLTNPYVAAEVLHQTQVTDERSVLLSVGSDQGVAAFDPVVAPEGLIGMVSSATSGSSMVMTWAHPEFRVSAFTADEKASGIVAPSSTGEGGLEFRGVPYRDSVPEGTVVLSSGLGGVYPKGIPIGTVAGIIRQQAGWERVYRLRPAADPSSTSHVLVLTGSPQVDLAAAFVSDSARKAVARAIADSAAQADSAKARAKADSLARAGQSAAPTPAPSGATAAPLPAAASATSAKGVAGTPAPSKTPAAAPPLPAKTKAPTASQAQPRAPAPSKTVAAPPSKAAVAPPKAPARDTARRAR